MAHVVHAQASNRLLNWQRQAIDPRDYQVTRSNAFKLKSPTALPPLVDLRSNCPPVYDQGQLGSCTANALVGALEYLEQSATKVAPRRRFVPLSRLFVYYNERVVEGTVKTDAGAMLRDGIKVLAKIGACSEPLFPYHISAFAHKPPPTAFNDALRRRIQTYAAVNQQVADLKQCLASGYPVSFGFTVYQSFQSVEVANTGIVPLPQTNEPVIGGHAVLLVGYNDADQTFLCRNSWSANWGLRGYFKMPYSYVTDPNEASDFWAITK